MHEDLVPVFTHLVGPDMVDPILAVLADRNDEEGFVVNGLPRPGLTDEVRAARLETQFPEVPLVVITPGTFQVLGVASLPGWPEAAANLLWSRHQADLATLTPDGRLVLAEGSGHFVQGDRPDLVIDAVTGIVADDRHATPSATRPIASRRAYPTA